ncbi:MAG: dihydroorotate dehydrogenase electron transfer subunit [candidate division Zixibacteria bacterium]|nr:dihydroorotate dehydrogenase electron transfer subunit [candidate division Zixibacteria bacterium]
MSKLTCESTPLVKSRDLKNTYYSYTFGPYPRIADCRPGQFIHLQLPTRDIYFRRPMSIASVDLKKKEVEIIFKIFGHGTSLLATHHVNESVNILGPLGVPFTLPRKNETAIMIAGGIGFPPLLFLAKDMIKRGHNPKLIEFFYGGRSSADIVERSRLRKLGVNFHPVTDDGSFGEEGFVTDSVARFLSRHKGTQNYRIYGCGPEAMLKATDTLGLTHTIPGQLSLEAPMPCGFGVCLGCVVPLRGGGHARVCVDGPVFEIGQVLL